MSESAPPEDTPEDDVPRRREVRRPGKRRSHHESDEDDDDLEDDYPRRSRDIGDDPAMGVLLPVGLSGWAIAAGYLGLVSVLCLPAPFAVLADILAIREMRRNPKKHGMGRTVFGIVMGSIGTVGLLALLASLVGARVTGK